MELNAARVQVPNLARASVHAALDTTDSELGVYLARLATSMQLSLVLAQQAVALILCNVCVTLGTLGMVSCAHLANSVI